MKKKVNLMILRAAEVLLSLVIATALFWGTADEESGLILSSGIAWLPSVLASVVLLLLLLEFFRVETLGARGLFSDRAAHAPSFDQRGSGFRQRGCLAFFHRLRGTCACRFDSDEKRLGKGAGKPRGKDLFAWLLFQEAVRSFDLFDRSFCSSDRRADDSVSPLFLSRSAFRFSHLFGFVRLSLLYVFYDFQGNAFRRSETVQPRLPL